MAVVIIRKYETSWKHDYNLGTDLLKQREDIFAVFGIYSSEMPQDAVERVETILMTKFSELRKIDYMYRPDTLSNYHFTITYDSNILFDSIE